MVRLHKLFINYLESKHFRINFKITLRDLSTEQLLDFNKHINNPYKLINITSVLPEEKPTKAKRGYHSKLSKQTRDILKANTSYDINIDYSLYDIIKMIFKSFTKKQRKYLVEILKAEIREKKFKFRGNTTESKISSRKDIVEETPETNEETPESNFDVKIKEPQQNIKTKDYYFI